MRLNKASVVGLLLEDLFGVVIDAEVAATAACSVEDVVQVPLLESYEDVFIKLPVQRVLHFIRSNSSNEVACHSHCRYSLVAEAPAEEVHVEQVGSKPSEGHPHLRHVALVPDLLLQPVQLMVLQLLRIVE
mmetsp:Transcript_18945/g.18088  ORF Transcript_18945/g.18088 Transcript_18945/m.18088 type:complete len:131 (+) Transcript_18945:1-393(+)